MDELIYENILKNDLKLASFGKRAISSTIDFVLIFIVFFILLSVNLTNEELENINLLLSLQESTQLEPNFLNSSNNQVAVLNALKIMTKVSFYFIGVYFFYILIFTFLYGSSVGKFICKISIVNQYTLLKPSFFSAFLRALSKSFLDIIFFPFGLLGYGLYFYGKSKRNINDMFSRTVVVENTL